MDSDTCILRFEIFPFCNIRKNERKKENSFTDSYTCSLRLNIIFSNLWKKKELKKNEKRTDSYTCILDPLGPSLYVAFYNALFV